MNIALLEKIKLAIMAEPQLFDMAHFIKPHYELTTKGYKQCGTSACIAGLAWILSGQKEEGGVYPEETARAALDITSAEAKRLFHVSNWPILIRRKYYDVVDNKVRDAEIACERIDYFIQTNGF